AIWAEKTVDLLIIEDDPAQCLKALIFALRFESTGPFGEIAEDYSGLAELLGAVRQYRRFPHLVDLGTIFRRASFTFEEIDENRLPVGADQVEHQPGAIGVARLGKAVKLIFGHAISFGFMRRSKG